jgi:hypothetical protein
MVRTNPDGLVWLAGQCSGWADELTGPVAPAVGASLQASVAAVRAVHAEALETDHLGAAARPRTFKKALIVVERKLIEPHQTGAGGITERVHPHIQENARGVVYRNHIGDTDQGVLRISRIAGGHVGQQPQAFPAQPRRVIPKPAKRRIAVGITVLNRRHATILPTPDAPAA